MMGCLGTENHIHYIRWSWIFMAKNAKLKRLKVKLIQEIMRNYQQEQERQFMGAEFAVSVDKIITKDEIENNWK